MKILIVEDTTERIEWFLENLPEHTLWITKDPACAIGFLKETPFDMILLDHDLADAHYKIHPQLVGESDEERYARVSPATGTGRDVSRWLEQHPDVSPNAIVVVHSWNFTGGRMMCEDLRARHALRYRFGSRELTQLCEGCCHASSKAT